MEGLRLRGALAVLGLVLIGIWIGPNFINTEKVWWPSKQRLNYGLDIQGGLHLVMGVDVEGVVAEHTQRTMTSLKADLEKEGISGVSIDSPHPKEGEIVFQWTSPSSSSGNALGAEGPESGSPASPTLQETKDKVTKLMDSHYSTTLQKLKDEETSRTYRFFEAELQDFKKKVIHQAIETIRNRIDEFGVAEPSISQQGSDRIVVQLPGMADAEKAKQLINTAAKLDFMIVEEKPEAELRAWIEEAEKKGGYSFTSLKYSEYVARLNQDLAAAKKLPEKTVIYFEKDDNAKNLSAGRRPLLLKADTNFGGEFITDASVRFAQDYGSPIVSLQFNPVGSRLFQELTKKNVHRFMAIVLDKVVKSAPVINTEIGGGTAQITMGTHDHQKALDEAKMISTALRAGALPASMEQLEERRVGPSLGADSIHQAQMASWMGALVIVLFMLLRYRTMGLISNLSLGINIVAVLALLTSLGATLTLPGIAGIALTVGFAVDSNVLINERIREELRRGSSTSLAIREGYHRALSAILDSNCTTAATALILLYFGTGPVRGFAVTLLIGIATTLFANVFVSKVITDFIVHRMGVKKISV